MKAGKLMKRAEKALKASPAIDHWQKDREEIEAEDLLMHAMHVDERPRRRSNALRCLPIVYR